MPISKIKSSAIDANAITGAGIADGTVTSADLDTNIDIAGTLDVTGATTLDDGLTVDKNGTVLTVDRAGINGKIVDFQKGGTSVGSVASVVDSYIQVGSGNTGVVFNSGVDAIIPHNGSGTRDAVTDLGLSSGRFKDLYLSGGVYLGGTVAANHLDGYEEGTWNPTYNSSGNNATITSVFNDRNHYTKVGRMVNIHGALQVDSGFSAGTGYFQIQNLPFTKISNSAPVGSIRYEGVSLGGSWTSAVVEFATSSSSNILYIRSLRDNGSGYDVQTAGLTVGDYIAYTITYYTT